MGAEVFLAKLIANRGDFAEVLFQYGPRDGGTDRPTCWQRVSRPDDPRTLGFAIDAGPVSWWEHCGPDALEVIVDHWIQSGALRVIARKRVA